MRTAARIVPAVLLAAAALAFNRSLLTVRLSELSSLLEEASGGQQVLNSLAISGKYELMKRRLTSGESSVENYELEARLRAFTMPQEWSAPAAPEPAPFQRAATGFVNAIRFLMAKPPLVPEHEDPAFRGLEAAYLEERGRRYRAALAGYNAVLPRLREGSELKANVLLHIAFCHSMVNEIDTARRILTGVTADYRGKQAGILAWKLLDFLDLIEERRRSVLAANPSELERARQAYLLVDYPKAVELLSSYIVKNPGGPDAAEALYYRGRSHEEMGELASAEADYRAVGSLAAAGSWAVESQRRQFLLGTVYDEDAELAREALLVLARHGEEAFVEAVRPSAEIMGKGSLAVWPGPAPKAVPEVTGSTKTPAGNHEAAPAPAAVPDAPAAVPDALAAVPTVPGPVPALETAAALPPAGVVAEPTTALPIQPPAASVDWERIASLETQKSGLALRLDREIPIRRGYNGWSWVSLGTGVTTTGLMGFFLYRAFDFYSQYQSATSYAQAKALREATLLNRNIAIASGVVGGAAFTALLTLQIAPPHPNRTRDAIEAVDAAIAELRGVSP